MQSLQVADYIVFGLSLLFSALAGPFYYWRDRIRRRTLRIETLNSSTSDAAVESFFMANRSLDFWPTTASLFVSFMSAIALVGIPAEYYTNGARFFIHSIGQSLGYLTGAIFIVPMMYRLRLVSTFDYLEMRFDSKILRMVAAVCGIATTTLYIAVVTYAPSVALEAVTPIPSYASILGIATITMFYTVLGGLRAVVIVDLVQTLILFTGIIVALSLGFNAVSGGFVRAMEFASENGRLDFFDFNIDPRNTLSFFAMLIPPFFVNAGLASTNQASVQRYSALKSEKLAIASVMVVAPQTLLLFGLLLLLTVAMFAYFNDVEDCCPLASQAIDSPNQLTTLFVVDILGQNVPGLSGLWIASLFAASMSTMSSGYNSIAAIIWEDFLKLKFQSQLNRNQVDIILKLLCIAFGVLTALLAIAFQHSISSGTTVIRLVILTASVTEAVLYIAYGSGMLLPWATWKATLAGMFGGGSLVTILAAGQLAGLAKEWSGEPIPPAGTTANCAMLGAENNSTSIIPQSSSTSQSYFFSISPFYYPFLALLVGLSMTAVLSYFDKDPTYRLKPELVIVPVKKQVVAQCQVVQQTRPPSPMRSPYPRRTWQWWVVRGRHDTEQSAKTVDMTQFDR